MLFLTLEFLLSSLIKYYYSFLVHFLDNHVVYKLPVLSPLVSLILFSSFVDVNRKFWLILEFNFFLGGVGRPELRASHLQSRHSTT
jgi:hypothetical protein